MYELNLCISHVTKYNILFIFLLQIQRLFLFINRRISEGEQNINC